MRDIVRSALSWWNGPGRGSGATVVGIMDRDAWTARTDNIVVVDARHQRLVWIPRDLWSPAVGDRVNEAYARGGHPLLQAAARECGLPAASSIVLLRSAAEHALAGLRVTVPVPVTRRYWYPLEPTKRLQDGAKLVSFEAPEALLAGERVHQWIGARKSADTPAPRLPDLDRIQRQQVLLRRLLEEGFPFTKALDDPARVALSDPGALPPLAAVRPGWRMELFDRVEPVTIDGKMVLRRRSHLRPRWPSGLTR